MFPAWFHIVSILFLLLGIACALVIAVDVIRNPQKMAVMNIVWPVTALFGTVLVLFVYFRYGRLTTRAAGTQSDHDHMQAGKETPYPIMVLKGALHCGSGCMIGDILAEWLAFLVPGVAFAFGWQTVFEEKMFAVWGLDFVFAFLLGIAFQYFAIKPMRDLPPGKVLVAALKADALSLTSWQVGMYGAMAFFQLAIFPAAFATKAEVATPEFWFAMQIAMIAGLLTAYPVNWWLISSGIKEKM